MTARVLADPGRDIWDRRDVAAYFVCSSPTVGTMVKRDGLPSVKVGRLERFRRVDVIAWFESRARASSGEKGAA